MRKILLSLTVAAALAAPLALAGTASASAARPAAAYCCVDSGTYYTSMAGFDHWWHVAHVAHEAYMAYLGGH
jgi:ABC-type sugar transport system substrate-binding protein